MVRRLLVATSLVAGLLIGAVPIASAAAPERGTIDNHFSGDAGPLCSFPVTVQVHSWGFYEYWSGDVAREVDQIWEQDTLVGPGGSLVSEPYRYAGHAVVDTLTGDIMKATSTGLAGRFLLPDGSHFVAAGQIDWLTHTASVYEPDHGSTGDIAALCAALS